MSHDRLQSFRGRVSLGLGLIQLGRPWGAVPHESLPADTEVDALVEEAYNLGVRFFDTAPAYGDSERKLGSTRHAREGNLVVATKYGEYWQNADSNTVVDHSIDRAVRSLTASIGLMGSVDLVQVHKCSAQVARNQQVLDFVALLKSLHMPVGASVSDPEALEAVLQTGMFDAVQLSFSEKDTRFSEYFSEMRKAGLLPIINRPFAMGALAATREMRREAMGFIAAHVEEGIILTGTSTIPHLRENFESFADAFLM